MLLTDTSTYLKIYFLAYKVTIYILLHYCLLTIYTLSILFSYIPWVLFHICHLSYSYFVMQFLSHILGVMTWHGRVTSWGRHFIAVLYTEFFCSICHTLFSAFRFFQHYTFMSNCVTCEMYISPLFLYTSETWDGSICLYILIFTSFLSPYVCYRWWVMSYGMADDVSSHLEMYFLDVVPELFLVICIFLYLPKKHFLFIINLVGIASHSTCRFLSDYCINFHVYMLMCFHFWYPYIFLSANPEHRL